MLKIRVHDTLFNNSKVCYNFFVETQFFHPILIKDKGSICLQNKSSFIKLGPIIYTSSVRIVFDHIDPFNFALLEFYKEIHF